MTRLSSLSLVLFLACNPAIHAQMKDPPKYVTNSIGMKFVWIRPGTFNMGSPKQEEDRRELEVQHRVELTKGFYMGVYPVTQEQWHAVMNNEYVRPAARSEGYDIVDPSRFQGPLRGEKNLPVETISWNDCQAYIQKLRTKEKNKQAYRLPTEAEWEYACRAGTATPFSFGESISTAQANFAGGVDAKGKKEVNRKRTTPAGSFPPNAWGLYDMHGNLAQWCQDRFGPYPQQGVVDPQGAKDGGSRVLRGGSWQDGPSLCRSACRAWNSPDNRGTGIWGFRLCYFPE